MAYSAIVAKIQTRQHPNADRLLLGDVSGNTVVVGLDTKDGDLGVYFESDGQLSLEFCEKNNLLRKKDENGKNVGGYFEESRRVRVQPFRGVKSDGFWVPLRYFIYTGFDVSKLEEGFRFTELNGKPICNKYYSPATLRRMQRQEQNALIKKRKVTIHLPEHKDTDQWRFASPKSGDTLTVTLKMHGTSVRYGRVEKEYPLNIVQLWINKLFKRELFKTKKEMGEFLGSRRVILPKTKDGKYSGGYYGDGEPYSLAAKLLEGKLRPGEVVYGELVGYTSDSKPLFSQKNSIKDLKIYPEQMVYSYGCAIGEAKFYVYRITLDGYDLSWQQVKLRCTQLGVDHVPQMAVMVYDENQRESINRRLESMAEGQDPLGITHIREGICIRAERLVTNPDNSVQLQSKIYKLKGYYFRLLEGLIKDHEDYVDLEEVS